jgi:hypothetical protein
MFGVPLDLRSQEPQFLIAPLVLTFPVLPLGSKRDFAP